MNAKFRTALSAALILFSLTACKGGGGGGGDGTIPANQSPTVSAGADFTVMEMTSVTLSGEASDIDGTIESTKWIQTSGSTVSLRSATELTASFDTPDILSPEILSFELTVTDDKGATASDSINITVDPNPAPMKAVLGPLSGSEINVYRFNDLGTPVESVIAESSDSDLEVAGNFHLSLSGIPDNEWVLATALGGTDIDPNDDGVMSEPAIENIGKIHLIIRADAARNGGASITLASEMIYKKIISSISLESITEDDLVAALISASESVIRDINFDGIVNYGDILEFNPVIHSSELMASSELQASLIAQIHNGKSGSENDQEFAAVNQISEVEDIYKEEEYKVTLKGAISEGNEYLLSAYDETLSGEFKRIEYVEFLSGNILRISILKKTSGNIFDLQIVAGNNNYKLKFLANLWPISLSQNDVQEFAGKLPHLALDNDTDKVILNVDKSVYSKHSETYPIVLSNGTQVSDGELGFSVEDDDPVYSFNVKGNCEEKTENGHRFLNNCLRYYKVSKPISEWDSSIDEELTEAIKTILGLTDGWGVSKICYDNTDCLNLLDVLQKNYISIVDRWVSNFIKATEPYAKIVVTNLEGREVPENQEVQSSEFFPTVTVKAPSVGTFGFGKYGRMIIELVKYDDCKWYENIIDVVDNLKGMYCNDEMIAVWDDLILGSLNSRSYNGFYNIKLNNNDVISFTTQKGIYLSQGNYGINVRFGDFPRFNYKFTVKETNSSNATPPIAGFSYNVGDGFIDVNASSSFAVHGGDLQYQWDVGSDGVYDITTYYPVTKLYADTGNPKSLTLKVEELGFGSAYSVQRIPEFSGNIHLKAVVKIPNLSQDILFKQSYKFEKTWLHDVFWFANFDAIDTDITGGYISSYVLDENRFHHWMTIETGCYKNYSNIGFSAVSRGSNQDGSEYYENKIVMYLKNEDNGSLTLDDCLSMETVLKSHNFKELWKLFSELTLNKFKYTGVVTNTLTGTSKTHESDNVSVSLHFDDEL